VSGGAPTAADFRTPPAGSPAQAPPAAAPAAPPAAPAQPAQPAQNAGGGERQNDLGANGGGQNAPTGQNASGQNGSSMQNESDMQNGGVGQNASGQNETGLNGAENSGVNETDLNGRAYWGEDDTENLNMVFLDVGQADATLIKSGQQTILVDAGSDGQAIVAKLGELGISHIDLFVVSTWNTRMAGGVRGILGNLDVGEVWVSEEVPANFALESISEYIDRQEVITTNPKAGDTRKIGDITLEVYNPQEQEYLDYPQANAIVMRVDFGKFCAFLPSDLEQELEQPIVGRLGEKKCAVYKWGNNGAGRPQASVLFNKISPSDVIISVGQNDLGLPSSTTLQRISIARAGIYRTDLDGNIYVNASMNGAYSIETGLDLKNISGRINN
ncbi:MAG: MBL fold metallo-hydrolase, partial [Candidatus Micrarchaeota archaeon]